MVAACLVEADAAGAERAIEGAGLVVGVDLARAAKGEEGLRLDYHLADDVAAALQCGLSLSCLAAPLLERGGQVLRVVHDRANRVIAFLPEGGDAQDAGQAGKKAGRGGRGLFSHAADHGASRAGGRSMSARKPSFWTPERDAAIRAGYAKAHSLTRIAADIGDGCTRNMVAGRADRLGLAHPKPRGAKLDAEDVAWVRRGRVVYGATHRALGQLHGLSADRARECALGRSYRRARYT